MVIRILSDETINKIAAGEVIERPANAVKELVENALDAGSSRIEIELFGAGRKRIRISDDGTGMSREDLALAVTRHATSKITAFNDIDNLTTLGFRGEALPSVAAVSHLTLQSHQRNSPSGWSMKLAGGVIKESNAWAGAPGTVIDVADIFFNTPARAKFLKSDVTERHRTLRIIEELAIAHPDVSFHVLSEGKNVLTAPRAATLIERITDVLGAGVAAALIPVAVQHPSVRITAFITRTENSLPTKNIQYLFVNRRPVNTGKLITHSLYEAYRENLPSGRHPGVVIFIDIQPSEIDINVHPTKREVRFAREAEIHDLLCRALKDALRGAPVGGFSVDKAAPPETAAGCKPHSEFHRPEREHLFAESRGRYSTPMSSAASSGQIDFSALLGKGNNLRSLDQVFGLYLVVQSDENILIIDQHAAAERIRYERYLASWKDKKIPVQGLLLPLTLELPASQAGVIRENIPLLREAGWDIDEFGTNTLRVTGFPSVLGTHTEIKDILDEILDALDKEIRIPPAEKVERIIRSACRASIKAGESISSPETVRLVEDLFHCQAPYTCPHGRPTLFKISLTDLQKYFGRQ
jgi:DNA mismatch repair protein MutL